eukprot:Phypoly_transcript_15124.p1 GENE.Phypoly_transcript_15124~~Phypoly_transcript_15124.p1  ORF type:complete len:226 (+),score=10.46 Phypoly_transcript_15124:55-732(+)
MGNFVQVLVAIFVACICLASASSLCQCTSASGYQACINETQVSSCSSCSSSSCGSLKCYSAEYMPGVSTGSSCWSSSSSFSISKVKYKVEPTIFGTLCDQTKCCCLVGEVTVTRTASTITISGSTEGSSCTATSISTTYDSSLSGKSFIHVENFLRNGQTMISGTNGGLLITPIVSACSAVLSHRSSSNAGKVAGIVIAVLVVVGIAIGVAIYVIRRRRLSYSSV